MPQASEVLGDCWLLTPTVDDCPCSPCICYQTELLLYKTKLLAAQKLEFLHLTHSGSPKAQVDSLFLQETLTLFSLQQLLPVPTTAQDNREGTSSQGGSFSRPDMRRHQPGTSLCLASYSDGRLA